MKPVRTWIVIANGARARIVVNEGPDRGVQAVEGMDFRDEALQTGDIMSDKPGRSFDSVGGGRHAMALPSDPQRQREKQFAQRLADALQGELARARFDRLVVAAAPNTLGDLREAMSPQLRDKIHAEIAKDFTHEPNSRLKDRLADTIVL